ncbi:MAG: universal stress protein [Rhodoferax sp.]|nr:universal stress protein [Rhodoferax sp.]
MGSSSSLPSLSHLKVYMFKHILLATDGSVASLHAAKLAVGMAREHGAQLTALYVSDPYPYIGMGEINPMGYQAYSSAAQQIAAEAHAQVEALCQAESPAIHLQVRLVEDVAAASGIVDSAKELACDLIVLGSHGRSGIARLMLGSVATKVVAESSVPVLVTR